MNTQYLDDLRVGQTFKTNGVTITESDIIGFALKYDPQPFHLDVVEAAKSPYGGIIASGFQTLAYCFRCSYRMASFLSPVSVLRE